ncbi:MAG: NAD(+)/NADH kinase [Clostridia bacterium]|nr:NAD(+)/NADH kinase [Clostridia bacterium]
MQNIGIFVNLERDPELVAAKHTAAELISRGINVFVDEAYKPLLSHLDVTFLPHKEMINSVDLVVVLGGDGTILKVISDAAEADTPVIGINLGHLGFLTQAEKDDSSFFDKIANSDFEINHFMMLEARIFKNGKVSNTVLALNDIIFRGNGGKMLSLEVEVDGTVANRYLADGVIVSTSTGSTAYSLSCGGPIVHQSLDCMILTPICPHTLKSRCIVIPPGSSVRLKFDPSYHNDATLKADGIFAGDLADGDYIEILRATKRAPLAILDSHNYFDVIREKLSD